MNAYPSARDVYAAARADTKQSRQSAQSRRTPPPVRPASGLGMDFNPTFFSHPLAADGFTLSHRDASIRKFWIEHGIARRRIGAKTFPPAAPGSGK